MAAKTCGRHLKAKNAERGGEKGEGENGSRSSGGRLVIYDHINIYKSYEGRPKTPVFGFNYRRTGRSKSCQKLCARKERASAAQGTRKVTYSFEGFHVLMLPSFMKGGDIFLLYLCLSNQSDAKRSQSFCGHDFNNQQLTRQNPRKPRASRAQVARKHEKPQQDI